MNGGTSTGDAAGDTYTNIERIFGTGHDDIILGGGDDDILLGNGGDDFLTGGLGDDTLIGGAGVDSFGYDEAVDGADVISGFTLNETVFILGGLVTDFASLQALGTDAGANTIFDFGFGNTLTIVGHNLADLDADNFDFGGTSSIVVSESSDALSALESINDSFAFASEVEFLFDIDALI